MTINKHTAIDAEMPLGMMKATATADEQNTFGQLTLTDANFQKLSLLRGKCVQWQLKSLYYIKNELGERVGVAMGTALL